MFLGDIIILKVVYAYFKQAMVSLKWLVLLQLSLLKNFVGVASKNVLKIRLYPIYLLLAAEIGFILAWVFKGNVILAGVLSFWILKIIQQKLQSLLLVKDSQDVNL